MAEPTGRSTVSHLFTSSQPTVSSVVSVGCTLSSPQILPAPLMTNSPIMFAQLHVLVTIHIDHRRYFTQRFSPTGFILNAPQLSFQLSQRLVLAFRIKPVHFNSILALSVEFETVSHGRDRPCERPPAQIRT